MLAYATHEQGMNREVRTGPECPEDNLRNKREIATQTVGSPKRKKRREKERENFSAKCSNLQPGPLKEQRVE